jgi:hypothetical protein
MELANPLGPGCLLRGFLQGFLAGGRRGITAALPEAQALGSQGMTPAEYRQKFGLPHDYPMVAASYAAQRSALAPRPSDSRAANRTSGGTRRASCPAR